MTCHVLIVEDSTSMARSYGIFLENAGYTSQAADTAQGARDLDWGSFDCILMDLKLPDGNGMDLIGEIQATPNPPLIIVITSNGAITTAVEAVRAGAYDFLVKPFSAARLTTTLEKALETRSLRKTVKALENIQTRDQFGGFVGSSLPMQAVYKIIEQAASSDASVFITGDSGTGKELAAEALHHYSHRSKKPFVALNCAAIPKDLIESELFGHVKGAFTGATTDRIGAASRADGGTLFLDEICEMDIALQSKLLRFIQNQTFQSVGGTRDISVNLRIIAATNRSPMMAVREGVLREDLYFRLHVIPVALPPLCQRGTDILEIADKFLTDCVSLEGKNFNGFSAAARKALLDHPWHGNVRELQNKIRQAVVLHEGDLVELDMLDLVHDQNLMRSVFTPEQSDPVPSAQSQTSSLRTASQELWKIEREAIEHVISQCDGNIQKASRHLSISPSTIYRKRKLWTEREDGEQGRRHPHYEDLDNAV